MGTCYGRCCPQKKQRCRYKRSHYYDGESVVEFENLIDESPKEAVSIITRHEKELLENRQFDLLVEEHQKETALTVAKHAKEEKELELEEAVALEARKEALRIMKMAQSPDIINPAKLAIGGTIFSDSAENHNVGEQEYSIKKIDQEVQAKVVNLHYDQNSGPVANRSRDRLHTYSSTPPSSLDLEWENEIGIAASQQLPHADEDYSMMMSDTNSVYSNCSTQTSNGNELEWDGDFTSAHISELDLETERLISEIEQMTSDALNSERPNR